MILTTLKKATPQALQAIEEEKAIRKTDELFILFSLGSHTAHLIKQALDKLGVFCLVADATSICDIDIELLKPKGIVLSGGPISIYDELPPFDENIFGLGIPVLGICLGFQLWANYVGDKVVSSNVREFGPHEITTVKSALFSGVGLKTKVLQNHGDIIQAKAIKPLAYSENGILAAGECEHLYGVQFHPEVTETEEGQKIFENFCFKICEAKDRFPAEEVAKKKIADIKKIIGNKKVLIALSGGSDSSTCAYLCKLAMNLPGQLFATYIKGIDRPDDEAYALKSFGNQKWLKLEVVDATDLFLEALKGKFTMSEKRIAMRGIYKKILEGAAERVGAEFIVQGTLYTDISESGGGYDLGEQVKKARIKLHHNVGLNFKFPEITPLDDCVKDTGRNIGRTIGVPEELLIRHPFPGPGQVIRIEGEITAEKLAISRQADKIFIKTLRQENLYDGVWQAGATLINRTLSQANQKWLKTANQILDQEIKQWNLEKDIPSSFIAILNSVTTCNKGDDGVSGLVAEIFLGYKESLPSYDFLKHVSLRITNEIKEIGAVTVNLDNQFFLSDSAFALWSVWSVNGFTAQCAELPFDFLKKVYARIRKESGLEKIPVLYRISGKPPSTIEWG